ncbi:hypothetical protein ACFSLT_16280 [Novosphingobium resinovorum]
MSLQREHGLLTIDEYADVSSRNSPDMLFHIMGFAAPMAPFDQCRAEHLKGISAARFRRSPRPWGYLAMI